MPNKLNAHKVTADGETFDSRKEYRRWLELKQLERDGKITALQRQVSFELLPKQTRADGKADRAVTYRADFCYNEVAPDGSYEYVVEDVKGYRGGATYAVFTIKRKLLLWRYGLTIREI